ncbi:Cilia- and flagella-associated protein 57 [Thoreauomyces humboldtii]|nr:Cilia- and flagella-associated protein 57 [Thoreauomyces humboldtii]
MSIASVAYSHVFGVNTKIRRNIYYVDQHTLMYSAGCNIISANVEGGAQRYIPITGYGITALDLSLDRRLFAAGERGAPWDSTSRMSKAERTGTRPGVSVYEGHTSRKRRTLYAVDSCVSKEFLGISFSSDTKYMAAQGGAPDWLLHFYVWEKGKLLATISTSPSEQIENAVLEIGINPMDETEICVLADGTARIYRYQEGGLALSNLKGIEDDEIICYTWLAPASSRLAFGTRCGCIRIADSGCVMQTVTPAFPVLTIFALSGGFACAGKGGVLSIFDRFNEEGETADLYRLGRKIPLPDDFAVRSMTGNAAEEVLILEAESGQIYRFILTEQRGLKGEDPKFVPVGQPFHHGAIIGIDVCVRKPLIVTCSIDRSIRIWDYVTNTCQLIKHFTEEPHSVSLHPSGLHLLVGFSDKLRFMNVLMDDLRVFREVGIRGCRECRFSTGGHMFAATHGNMVQVYSTWTCENIANFKGHNGRIKSLSWTPGDSYLVSAGADGAVYAWNIAEAKRENEYILKTTSYTCALVAPDGRTMWAVGNDRVLKEITESTVTMEMESDQVLTQIGMSTSGRMLFAGTAIGTVRAIKFPLSGHMDDFQEHVAHGGAVTKLRISYDDQYLFSVSEDGVLFSFKISEREERGLKKEKTNLYADEILITKSDLEEKTIQTSELERSLEELQIEHEYQLRLRDMNFNEKMKDLSERFMDQLEDLKKTTASLRLEKEKLEIKHEETIAKVLAKHSSELHDHEAAYNQELMAEYDKYQDAQTTTNAQQERWQRQMQDRDTTQRKALAEAQAEWEGRLGEKSSEIVKVRSRTREARYRAFENVILTLMPPQLQTRMQTQYAEHIEEQRQVMEDVDTEIERLHVRYERRLYAEREDGARLKGENGIMRKKFNTLTKDIDDNRLETARMRTDEKRLRSAIESLEKEIGLLKSDMAERDVAIQEKERRVYDLKKKNQELEKFKFVLDFRIKELKEQVEPRENHIKNMTSHIKDINTSLETLSTHKAGFTSEIADLGDRLANTKQAYACQHAAAHRLQHHVRAFQTDTEGLIAYIQDASVLRVATQKLGQKYLTGIPAEDLTHAEVDPDVAREDRGQQQVLRDRVAGLRKLVESNAAKYRIDSVGSVEVNRKLIGEINRLRNAGKRSSKSSFEVVAFAQVPRKILGLSAAQVAAQGVPAHPVRPPNVEAETDRLPSIVGSKAVSFAT